MTYFCSWFPNYKLTFLKNKGGFSSPNHHRWTQSRSMLRTSKGLQWSSRMLPWGISSHNWLFLSCPWVLKWASPQWITLLFLLNLQFHLCVNLSGWQSPLGFVFLFRWLKLLFYLRCSSFSLTSYFARICTTPFADSP